MVKKVPKFLRIWFLIHFVVDLIFGVLLILFPKFIASIFGLTSIELVSFRLVGAALLGIGGVSFYAHRKSKEVYDSLLTLKIIWSLSAISALLISKPVIWPVVLIFSIFSAVWIYYKLNL